MTFAPFSPTEIAAMQADMLASLTDHCTIQRKSGGSSGDGTPSKTGATYANVATNVACRLKYRRRLFEADLANLAQQIGQIAPMMLYVPLGTDIQAQDQVVMSPWTLTSGGTGYPNSGSLTFSGGGGSGAAGTYTAVAGVIQSLTITAPGTGYTGNPIVGFSGGGSGASASVTIAGGQVAGIPYLVLGVDTARTTRMTLHAFVKRVGP